MKNLFILIAFLFGLSPLFAQVSSNGLTVQGVHPQKNPTIKVVHSIVGQGVKLAGYSTNQATQTESFGNFTSTGSLGIEQGLLMTTGRVDAALGPNVSTGMTGNASLEQLIADSSSAIRDADLEKLVGGMITYDACVLELDVVPYGDTLAYNYIFASEEYDEFVGSPFNDVFAFFISGPGIEGQQNIALLPGTDTPVAINNVNDGNPLYGDSIPATNPSFYVRNTQNNSLEYDGYTRLFQVRQAVIPGETYHLKLAIADVSDPILDSGVFIEAQSLIAYYANHLLHFSTGDFSIDAKMEAELETMLDDFYASSAASLLITGHTDAVGSEAANLALSRERVDAIQDWFLAHGVQQDQMVVDYRGETMPVTTNQTAKGKSQNRRVEVKFLGDTELL